MTKKPRQLEVKYLPLKTLKRRKNNPRLNAEAVDAIVKSIQKFGYTNPILVRRANREIIAGDTRVQALERIGETHAPVILLDLSETDAATYAIFDNKSVEMTPWDLPKLAEVMAGLKDLAVDTDLTGFSAAEVSDLLAPAYMADQKEDEVPEPPKVPVTKPGDLWVLGEHRLLCGDSTKAEDVGRVMGGEKAGLCFTSPPYAQQRDYTEASKAKVADWDGLMRGVFGNLPMADDGQVLVNLGLVHRDGEWVPYWDGWIDWMRAEGWRRFGWYVWDKLCGQPGDWAGRFRPSHEFIFHFNKQAVKPEKTVECINAGRVVHARSRKADGELKIHTHDGRSVQEERIEDSVIRCGAAKGQQTCHPAPFPVALPAAIIPCWEGICYEPFAGSGTTIIAAEKLSRKCYGLEIEPKYCDVIVERWQKFTGQKARRA